MYRVPQPAGLSLRETMMIGTAGLTAAMCVDALLHHLGFQVTASTGKPEVRLCLDVLKPFRPRPTSAYRSWSWIGGSVEFLTTC